MHDYNKKIVTSQLSLNNLTQGLWAPAHAYTLLLLHFLAILILTPLPSYKEISANQQSRV